MESVKIALSHPVKFEAVTYTEFTMRAPKIRDKRTVMKMSGTDADREIRLFANLCDVPEGVMDELFEPDYTKLQEAYRSFFGAATPTTP